MKVVKQLLEMKFSQDMMVYNPFPSLNPVKNSHETGNDKKEWNGRLLLSHRRCISEVRSLLLKWFALYFSPLSQCKLYPLF